jgi:hypothetical protein
LNERSRDKISLFLIFETEEASSVSDLSLVRHKNLAKNAGEI